MAKRSKKAVVEVVNNQEQTMDQNPQVTEASEAPATPQAQANVLVLLSERKNKAGNVTGYNYGVPGRVGTVRISKKLFASEAPEAIAVNEGVIVAPDNDRLAKKAAKGTRQAQTRMSAEERVAKLQAKIDKANANAAKNAERVAKIQARLSKGQAATGSADVAAEGQPQVTETADASA